MSPRSNNSIKKALYQCIVAIALVMGFFSVYSSHSTSQLKNITQTEWVEFRKSLKKVRCVFEKKNKAPAEFNKLTLQSEFFNLLAKNRITRISCKVNKKLVQSIPDIKSKQFKLRPQLSDDYFISA
jgi:cell division protein FtsL